MGIFNRGDERHETQCPARVAAEIVAQGGGGQPTPKVRRLVLERDGFACACCGASIISRPYSLGLRLRAAHGGRPVPSNLLTLLEPCRERVGYHADPMDEARGYRVESWQDPALIPVMFAGGYRAWLADDGTLAYEAPAGAIA
jgi:hypothetical protein